nr:retrovirus-related Pol polyprotein from transposon TNT 1-94 [Tanacetum cinerariifolium]
PVAPNTAEQRLARKNELKAHVSAVTSVSAASAKVPISALPNVDTLSNAVIYSFFSSQSNSPQLDNDDLKQIEADDLDEMDLKWQMAMLTVECYNCHRKWHFAREYRLPKDTRRNVPVETHRRNVPVETSTPSALVSQCDKSVEARILVYQQNETVFEEDIKLLKLDVQLSNNALVVLRKNFEKAEQGRDKLKLKLKKFQTYSKNLSQLLASQTNDKTRLGYDNQVFTSSMFDCDEIFSFESDVSMPASPVYDSCNRMLNRLNRRPMSLYLFIEVSGSESTQEIPSNDLKEMSEEDVQNIPVYDRYQSGEGYHAIPPPYTRTFMPPKPDLVFHDAPNVNETIHNAFNVELSPTKHDKDLSHRPSAPIIEDWVSDSEDEFEADPSQNDPSFVQPTKQVKTHRPSVKPVEHSITPANYKTDIPKLKSHRNSRNRKACFVCRSLTYLIKDLLTRSKLVPLTAARPVNTAVPLTKVTTAKVPQVNVVKGVYGNWVNPQHALKDKGVIDSGCSRHMTGNMSYLSDFEEINGGYIAFGGNLKGGKITGKDPLGKFNRKADEGFLVGYSVNSKAFRVFNSRTRIVQETFHINFLENKPNVVRSGPTWLFDIDTLTKSMNYQPVTAENQPNPSADPQNTDGHATFEVKEPEFEVEKPKSKVHVSPSSSAKTKKHDDKTKREANGKIPAVGQISTDSTNTFSAAGPSNTVVSLTHEKSLYVDTSQYPDDPNMPALEDITYSDDEKDVGAEADFTNLETNIIVSPIPTTRVHKDHPVTQIIGDLSSATQTRSMTRMVKDQGGLTQINNEDFHTCMFACFLSQEEPKREEGIDYEEVFTPVARIEAIRLFLAYASFMGFMVYQMDVKSAFLYGTIEEEVYVCQPPGNEDPDYPDKDPDKRGKIDQTLFIKKQKGDILLVQVYVDDIIFGLTNKDLCKAFEKLMKDKFQMSSMGELIFFLGLQVKQKLDGIFISQDKYVAKILRKFGLTDGKSASTPIDTEKPLLKDPDSKDVDMHTYRSMIGSLMYLTSSGPDIMFAVCACARFQVTPKALHLHALKRIFRYLKGKPHLGLWYPKDSPFNLVAYSDSDYASASLDRKSTTRGYQFLGCRFISW